MCRGLPRGNIPSLREKTNVKLELTFSISMSEAFSSPVSGKFSLKMLHRCNIGCAEVIGMDPSVCKGSEAFFCKVLL